MLSKLREFVEAELNLGVLSPTLWKPETLTPDEIATSLENVNFERLKRDGIESVVIDYDGVIAPYHSTEPADPDKVKKLHELEKSFKVAILSNRRGKLLEVLKETLPDYAVISSERMKPHPDSYMLALEHFGTEPHQTALLEDRLITGTSGGNRVGMNTIWITPPEKDGEEPLNVRIYRKLEETALKLYQRLGLTQQNKHQIRDEDQYLVDLHFHLGKQDSLRPTISRLGKTLDVVCLTERGHRFSNEFEYNFDSFQEQLSREGIGFRELDETVLAVDGLYFVRAQEIHTQEGYDLVVVGVKEDLPDDVSYRDVVRYSSQGITIFSTPYLVPNSLRVRQRNNPQTEEIAREVDAVETHNQNIFGRANRYAKDLVGRIEKPGVAVSDSHRYSRKDKPINASGIVVNGLNEDELVQSLKSAISGDSFETYEVSAPLSLLELFNLKPREIIQLYRGK
jgi:HAD superfamily phosphatase (TIGR01668 family)